MDHNIEGSKGQSKFTMIKIKSSTEPFIIILHYDKLDAYFHCLFFLYILCSKTEGQLTDLGIRGLNWKPVRFNTAYIAFWQSCLLCIEIVYEKRVTFIRRVCFPLLQWLFDVKYKQVKYSGNWIAEPNVITRLNCSENQESSTWISWPCCRDKHVFKLGTLFFENAYLIAELKAVFYWIRREWHQH